MNELQLRLWRRMIDLLEEYHEGHIGFCDLVGGLEGALDAGEFHDGTIREGWYERWSTLEIRRASKGDAVTLGDVSAETEAMKRFLAQVLESVERRRDVSC